jgi:ESCRT-I complex subunit TSG101
LDTFDTLKPKTDYFNQDKLLLLCIFGVLPINYKNNAYNIPIKIWIPKQYPKQGPMVYVVPTDTMYIKPGTFLDSLGSCFFPFITNWNDDSNLVETCIYLAREFSIEPPVIAKAL